MPLIRGQEVFLDSAMPSAGWVHIQETRALQLHERRDYWFPLSASDRNGCWIIRLSDIAHVARYSEPLQDARRRLVGTVEPPTYGVMVTNGTKHIIEAIRVSHPTIALETHDIPAGAFVYWGVPMDGVERLGVHVTLSDGITQTLDFRGRQGTRRERSSNWPWKWEIVVLTHDSSVFLKK